MTVESVLDKMAEAHFLDWVERHLSAVSGASTIGYNQLPDTERVMRRDAMRPVLRVVIEAFDDDFLIDAMNAGDIAMHQAADLSQRLGEWLLDV